jgi:hypothetical protein
MKAFYTLVEHVVNFLAEAEPMDTRLWDLIKLRRRESAGEIN